MRLIILAAGRGSRLGALGADRPKALVPLAGRPLLDWTLEAALAAGIGDVVVVGGHRSDRLAGYPVRLIENPEYATTNMVQSLALADAWFGEAFVVSYGDIAYRPDVLAAVVGSTAPIAVGVDLDWRPYWEARFGDPLRDAESLRLGPDGTIRSIGQPVTGVDEIGGQYMGLMAFRGHGVDAFRETWRRAVADAAAGLPVLGRRPELRKLYLTDMLDEIASSGLVHAVPVHGRWVEIDSAHDLAVAERRWAETDASRVSTPDGRAARPRATPGRELRAW